MKRRRSRLGALVDGVGKTIASPKVVLGLLGAHVFWIVANLGAIPGLAVWDAPPFMLLATIDSALAPFVTLLILLRQDRDGRINELRQEVNLHVALRTTWQASATLTLLDALHRGLKIQARLPRDDLEDLERFLQSEELLEKLRHHLDRTEGRVTGEEGEGDEAA